MSSSHGNLVALNRRLQSITQIPADKDHPVKLEDFDMEPTKPKYVCAECAWTTSTNAGYLARHFTNKHTSRRKCFECRRICKNHEELEKHRSQEHRHLCLRCQRFFATVDECKHHEPCESQQHITPAAENGALSHTVIDRPIDGKAPASGQNILNRRRSVRSVSCPDPGCQLTLPDFDSLYEHYVALHPLSIVYRGHPKPFKCPFCSKRYQHDRFVPGHVRTHKRKYSIVPGTGDAEDQEALFRQSQIAMANRESQLRVETQAQADRTSSDEEEQYSVPIKEDEDDSLVLKDGVVYFDEVVESENSTPEQSNQTDVQEPQPCRKMTPIGLVFQASPANETPIVGTMTTEPELYDSMDLDDENPERLALDDDELPSKMSNIDIKITSAQLANSIFQPSLLREIVRAVQMQHFINVSEVMDLFTYFLDEHQRIYVLGQLASINLNQHDNSFLEALHGTAFKALIDAWVDFKRLAVRFAPQLMTQANEMRTGSGKSVTWALLQYCLNLENTIYRKQINIAHHFLRDPPLDDFVVTTDAPFPRLVTALAERVKNRTVHDLAIVFTNEMILREMGSYVQILQMIFRPLYPLAAGHERLWRELRLL
ncbi:MAG: hypothetical protein ALECFALPRED_004326 [Alectoria fallacina]|uniref:C2H2-type domain-containing protein n=1 Tax=Alectoria fallacina TaxID=1903189 RepID=A0A8H3FRE1_9LECA|nr:MAG: hypothetical protein ALECFALPRED_004326 [Alectoria fallacina]